MNKKEIAEIKKQFALGKETLYRLAWRYINNERDTVADFACPYLQLTEEEMPRYLDIFHTALSGGLEKKLFNLEFPLEQEKEGGSQELLLKLRDSKLADTELLEEFCDSVVETFSAEGPYLILLGYGVYDVPQKTKDGATQFDSSDEVYPYVFCAICPASLEKAELFYDPEKKHIHGKDRNWVFGKPEAGILFPAFNDRMTDIHSCLYYAKSAKCRHPEMVSDFLKCQIAASAEQQAETFKNITDVLECSYDQAKAIHDELYDLAAENAEGEEPCKLNKKEVWRVLEKCDAPQELKGQSDETFDAGVGEKAELTVANILPKKVRIETAGVVLETSPERSGIIKKQVIDGREYLLVPLETGAVYNGIELKKFGTVEE